MVTTTETLGDDGSDTVTLRKPPATGSREPQDDRPTTIYYVCWRLKPNHPWHSQEYYNRFEAHCSYFAQMQRGMEVYLEVRRRTAK